jgi:ubiquinone/menaquinone biosynthesis C-methylase UbiE/outer membrane lipoprotein-sorting protein
MLWSSVFPRLYDVVMGWFERGMLARWRHSTVTPATGLVLEIGAGTGLDFAHYRPGTMVVASDPDLGMLACAKARADSAAADIRLVAADAEALPFRPDTFDTGVVGLALCSIPHPERALAEVRRTLHRGGAVRVLEHVRARNRIVAAMQDWLTPIWASVANGCRLNRDPVSLVSHAGFELQSVTEHARGHVVEIVARRTAVAVLLALGLAASRVVRAQQPNARDVVDRAEGAIWGKTLQAQLTMTVTTPRWTRTLELSTWIERPRRSFIRILAPAKEAGIASLRIGGEMWNYLPAVERTIKIPPSMMLQPWMGSDFTNDDLVKESSLIDDYTQRLVAGDTSDAAVYVVECSPKPDAAVVWGRIVMRVRRSDFLPVREEFYDERGALVRVLTFSDIRTLGGRTIPTKWEMRPTAKPGNVTTVVMTRATYDEPIASAIFTQRNLEKR